MKRIYLVTVFTIICSSGIISAQEMQLPDTIPGTPSFNMGEFESSTLPQLEVMFGNMTVDTPAFGEQAPDFDREQIEDIRRRFIDQIPRMLSIKLWDNQYAYPFIYSSRSRHFGHDRAGLGTSVQITDWLSADINAFLSGAYLYPDYPKKYINASASGTLRIKLHDRVYLLGMGEISAREGLDPRVAPGIGGKNSLGAGVEIYITEKFGITFTRTWENYRGNWHGFNSYGPVMRQGRPR